MDAFIKTAEAARHRLAIEKGVREISWHKVIGLSNLENKRSDIMRHLNPKTDWPKGHRIPLYVIDALAKVLPVTREELEIAAAHAAGYTTIGTSSNLDLRTAVSSFFPDDLDDQEFARRLSNLAQLHAELSADWSYRIVRKVLSE